MDYLTVTQAAARLDLTTGRVCQMVLAGRLRARKAGPLWLIKPADLDAVRHRKSGRPRREAIDGR
jgi:excisionase family DNA binding protein